MHQLAAAFFAAVGVLVLGGCSTGQLDRISDQAQQTRQVVAEQLAKLPPEAEATPTQNAARAVLKQTQAMADAALASVDEARNRGWFETIADAVVPFVPAPWRGVVLAVGGVAALLESLRRKSRGLASLARSTVGLAEADPTVAEAIAEHASELRKVQSPEAKRAIDKAQRAVVMTGKAG